MQSIQIRFGATANFNDVNKQVLALQARLSALQKQMAVAAPAGGLIDPKKVAANSRQLADIRANYLNVLNAQGQFAVETGKVTSATESMTKALSKQNLSIKQAISNRTVLMNVYREQLALQNASAIQWTRDGLGGARADLIIPRQLPAAVDTAAKRVAFFNSVLAANSTQMINWGKNVQWAGRQLTVGFTVPFSIIGGMAAKMAYDVESELVRVEKVYDTFATNAAMQERELSRLRAESFTMAANAANMYGASLKETLEIEAGLAATGVRGPELLQQTTDIVRVATLGEMDYQKALEMSIALQNAFGLSTEEVAEKMNFMNSVENATSLSIAAVAEAVPRAATAMANLGVSVEEMTVLLVAMKERGVDAAEGANALKSAATRLLSPTPRAQEIFREQFGVDVLDLARRNAGNLFDILRELATVMEGSDTVDKAQALSALFGTFQVNRLSAALSGLGDDLAGVSDGSSQTARAIEEMLRTPEEHAATAEGEIQRWQQSVSGRIARAMETFKTEMAKLGQSFLPMVAKIVQGGAAVVKWFNELPDGIKRVVLVMAGLIAVTGPLVMVIGLIGNLLGNVGKGITFLVGLSAKFNIVNASQRVAALLAKASTVAFDDEARSANLLAASIGRVDTAMAKSNKLRMMKNVNLPAVNALNRGRTPEIYDIHTRAPVGREAVENSNMVAANAERTSRNWSGIARSVGMLGAGAIVMSMMTGSSSEMAGHMQTVLIAATLFGPLIAKGIKAAMATDFMRSIALHGRIAAFSVANYFSKTFASLKVMAAGLGTVIKGMLGPIGIVAAAAGLVWMKVNSEIKKAREEQRKIEESASDWADALGFVQTEVGEIVNESGEIEQTIKSIAEKMSSENPALVNSMREAATEAERMNIAIAEGIKVVQSGGTPEQARQAVEAMLSMVYGEGKVKELMVDVKLDFGDTEEVAEAQAKLFADTFKRIAANEFEQGAWETFGRFFSGTNELNARAVEAAKGAASQFYGAIRASDDAHAAEIYQNLMDNVGSGHREMFEQIEKIYGEELAEKGIKTLQDLANASKELTGNVYNDALQWGGAYDAIKQYGSEAQIAIQAERELAQEMMRLAGYSGEAVDQIETLAQARAKLKVQMTPEMAQEQYELAVALLNTVGAYERMSQAQQLNMLNLHRAQAGLPAVTSLEDGFAASVDNASDALDGNTDSLEDNEDAMKDWANSVVEATKSAYGGARDYALSQAQEIMQEQHNAQIEAIQNAGAARDKALDAQAEAAEEAFDARRERSEARYKAAMEAFDAEWERLMDQHTSKWERRNEAAQESHDRRLESIEEQIEREKEASDRRIAALDKQIERERAKTDKVIEGIDRQIEKERKAEELRKRIFEAEKTRIQRLSQMFKADVDFNVALNSGDLDEAAKLMSDADAQQQQWALDDLNDVMGSASQRKIERLEKLKKAEKEASEARIKQIEKEKKAEQEAIKIRTKNLQDLRKAEQKAHSAKMKEMKKQQAEEKKALDKKKKIDQDAIKSAQERFNKELDAERKRHKKGMDATREANRERTKNAVAESNARLATDKRNLELELEAIRASTPRNKAEYDKQITEIEKVYDKYGVRLQDKGDRWSETIGNGLTTNIEKSAVKLRDDIKWKKLAKEIANAITEGALGMDISDFKHWMKTGEIPTKISGGKRMDRPHGEGVPFARHEGGPIGMGGGKGSRVGYPASSKKFPSEVDVRAKVGEYIVNDKAHKMYGTDFFDAANNGRLPKDIGGPSLGIPGIFGALLAGVMVAALSDRIQAQSDQLMGFGVAGEPGQYANVSLNADQLSNAAIIAQVGASLGASHRDVVIALMTAMQESNLRNLNYGDRDSLGLFQQRNAWGSRDQRLDPAEAARMFFEGGRGGQRGLFAFKNRDQMSLTQAAQAVQVSAFPNAYAKWEAMARAILSTGGSGALPPMSGGWMRPVAGPVTSRYGMRKHPITGVYKLHDGTDIGAPRGTAVRAAQSGRVARASMAGGYGNFVVLDHNGGLQTGYAHLDRINVRAGQQIPRGHNIGPVGMTGYTTGPHLHFMAGKNGSWINPSSIIPGLLSGGEIMYDNTIANLHKKEAVLTAPLTADLKEGIAKIKNGETSSGNQYELNIKFTGPVNTEIDFKKGVKTAIMEIEKDHGPRRKIG